MTDRLYYTDPYMKETEAVVKEVRDGGFILDRTIFYPECGGQRGDSGYFGDIRIVTTIPDKDGEPLLVTDGRLPEKGEKALMRLDWDEREFGMVEHTAQHLLSSVLFSSFGINTVSVHHGEDEITIETDRSEIERDILLSAEEKAIKLISENRKVWMEEMEREKALEMGLRRTIKVSSPLVKIVFIDGQDAVACGGVHLRSLGEIEELVFVGEENIRGHVRTIWRAGKKAREMRRLNSFIVNEARVMLSSSPVDIPSSIDKLINENKDEKRELHALKKKMAQMEFNSKRGGCVVYSTECNLDDLIDTAVESKKKVFIAGSNNTFLYVGTKESFNMLKEKFSLRGGGREPLFRGQFSLEKEELLSSLESFLSAL